MKKSVFVFLFSAATIISSQTFAQVKDSTKRDSTKTDTVKKSSSAAVGATSTDANNNVVQAIAGSGYNNVLSSAIKSSGVDQALVAGEKYTIFAPNDKAFTDNKASLEPLTKDAAKEQKVLKKHIVKGEYTKTDILKALNASKTRSLALTTIDGDKLTLRVNEQKHLEIADATGNKAEVTVFDVKGTNGVAHVVDNVLLIQ